MSEVFREAVTSNDPRLQAALNDYFAKRDRGESVEVEPFVAQHVEVADELRSLIAFDEEARRMARGAKPKPTAPPRPKAEVSTHSVMAKLEQTSLGKPMNVGKSMNIAASRAAQPVVAKSPSDLPDTFGRYRVAKKLGAGAMGAVYLAHDTLLDRQVALKTPTFENDDDGELMKRFYREAKAVSKIKHHNLCGVYDVGEIDGRHYISMEFVPGKKLAEFIKPDKPMTEKQAMAVVRKIALAMHDAHTHGVIHRDLKPDNIMVNEKGEPVVMDFGLVHSTDSKNSTQLSQRGTLIGSPAYMSKEQIEGDHDKLTGATDQYSLGVILYQLLTSKLPFEGGIHAVLGAILTKEPPPPSQHRPDLNPHLEAVCLKMMAKEAANRYLSMKAASDALAEVAKGTSKAAGALIPAQSAGSSPSEAAPAFNFDFQDATLLSGGATLNHPQSRSSGTSTSPLARLVHFWNSLPPWQRLTSAAAASAAILFLGVVIVINSKSGKTRIKADGDQAVVNITRKGNKTTIEVDPGRDKMAESKDGTAIPAKSPVIGSAGPSTAGTSTTAPAEQYTSPFTGMKLTLIPVGEFDMGSHQSKEELVTLFAKWNAKAEYFNAQFPRHRVMISQPFYMGVHEVTQAEYENVMGTSPSGFSKAGSYSSSVSGLDTSEFPVEMVSWFDAIEFCNKLSLKDGLTPYYTLMNVRRDSGSIKSATVEASRMLPSSLNPGLPGYRLPTEAEWEYACRAGTTTAYHTGNTIASLDQAGWWGAHADPWGTSEKRTNRVGQKTPNGFGMFDMHGNVFEWCEDLYDDKAYSKRSGTTTDPLVTVGPQYRVLRGGSWFSDPMFARSAYRFLSPPGYRNYYIGFRVVRSSAGSVSHPTSSGVLDTKLVLFDGSNLSQWQPTGEAVWTISESDRTLIATGGVGYLVTKDDFGDFEFTIEMKSIRYKEWNVNGRTVNGMDSGIMFYTNPNNPANQMYEVNINEGEHEFGSESGSIFLINPFKPPLVMLYKKLARPREWLEMKIVTSNGLIQTFIDGQEASTCQQLAEGANRSGKIRIQHYNGDFKVRKIVVRHLDDSDE